MTRHIPDDVLDHVIETAADVLSVPTSAIGIDTRAADLEAWDSFGHVRLVLSLEALFGIAFTMAEIEAADSIAGLVRMVDAASRRRSAETQ